MRISTKGQVTIPHEIRIQLGMLPLTEVDFVLQEGGVLIKKNQKSKHKGSKLLQHLSGKCKTKISTDEIMKLTRS